MYFKHGLNIRYFQKRGYRQMIYNKIFPTVHEKDTQVASLNNNLEEDETVIYAKDIFYKCLKKHNVTNAFIYSGGSIMPLIDTLYNGDIKYYVNSHEQNCGTCAPVPPCTPPPPTAPPSPAARPAAAPCRSPGGTV